MTIEIHSNIEMPCVSDELNSSFSVPNRTDSNNSGSEGFLLPSVHINDIDIESYDSSSSTTGSGIEEDGEAENGDSLGYYKYSDSDKGKDSGIECSPNVEDFTELDKEVMEKIINQVEFYFSDVNILKDHFLLKHVRRNKQGYVSLKLVASFRKVKRFTKNWKIVAHSLKHSTKLEINKDGTKVRRKEPLPDYDETAPSRTVIAFKLPFENPTMENIGEMFSKCGDIALIRIIRPDGAIPADIKKFLHKYPEMSSNVCAMIEFENHEGAFRAAKTFFSSHDNWRSIQVIPVVQNTSSKSNASYDTKNKGNEIKRKKKEKRQDRVSQLRKSESSTFGSCLENEQFSSGPRRNSSSSINSGYLSTSPKYSQESSYRRHSFSCNQKASKSPTNSRKNSKPIVRQKSNSCCDNDSSNQMVVLSNPWVQRRLLAAREKGCTSPTHNSRLLIPNGVIRLPKGPDGTNGFNWNRLKPRAQFVSSTLVTVGS
ncbi:la-related protein 6-like [Limulus polyphemus]|uniref:La-related protein 6-like n=1 Tax=Limulus polyphemus TaxID=6850 RepID=A0ABM1B865_LIMPO|nr:la-related protein 6-like [Limulus polyphemus]